MERLFPLLLLSILLPDLLHSLALVERRLLTVVKGRSITLEAGAAELRRDSHVVWLFGSLESTTVIAALFDGRSSTDYSDRFGDRLQLDTRTASLTLSNLSARDTGLYQLKLLKGDLPVATFTLSVYDHVSKPRTTSLWSNDTCRVLCSVENGRDVTLSWTRGKEILNQTSSPHLNTTLSLPLDVGEQDNDTYSCVSSNPVSTQSERLDTVTLCQAHSTPSTPTVEKWAFPSLCGFLLGLLLAGVYWKRHKTRRKATTGCAECSSGKADPAVYWVLGDKPVESRG